MKFVFVIASLIATSLALSDDIDWSNVKVKEFDPISRQFVVHDLNRIVGGEEAVPNSIPYQVATIITTPAGLFFCGASLISVNYALTAAHCVDAATSVQVILGAHYYQQNEGTQKRYTIPASNIKVHSGWDANTLIDDIAVLQFPESIILSKEIQLISLPKFSEFDKTFVDEVAKVSGWGKDSDQSSVGSPMLRFVNVPVMAQKDCKAIFGDYVHLSNVCINGGGGLGSCSGDSGGPLVIGNKQIGVVSYGAAAGCELGYPSVFSRLTHFLDWLDSNTDAVILK